MGYLVLYDNTHIGKNTTYTTKILLKSTIKFTEKGM